MDYYIGVDIGTTSTKAVAFSQEGKVLVKAAVGYPILHPQPNWSEQDPDEILEAIIVAINKIAASLPRSNPVFVSFSAAMHSLLAVDQAGNPLTACMIWADNRASSIADALRNSEQGRAFYQASGVPVHAMSPLCKLLWLSANRKDVFSATHKFIGIKEYVFSRLFEKYVIDTGVASATALLNIHTLHWDAGILAFAGLREEQLSTVVTSTHIEYLQDANRNAFTTKLAAFLNAAFVIGGSDGGLANIGSGAIAPDSMAVTIGTSGAARMVVNGVYTDEKMRTFCYHLKDTNYIIGGAGNNGAVVLQWLKESIFDNSQSYESLLDLAASIEPGADGLLFLPYLMGERAPLWNSHAKGVFFGLTITHTKAHMVRAALEGVIYCVYSIAKILMENKQVKLVFANGGFTATTLWVQMLADVFDLPVFVPQIEESSALGAVMVGLEALNLSSNLINNEGTKYEPNVSAHAVYQRQFSRFEKIYELVKTELGSE